MNEGQVGEVGEHWRLKAGGAERSSRESVQAGVELVQVVRCSEGKRSGEQVDRELR